MAVALGTTQDWTRTLSTTKMDHNSGLGSSSTPSQRQYGEYEPQSSSPAQAAINSSAGDAASMPTNPNGYQQPLQQQSQQPWTPSPNAAPFYPTFNPYFQNPSPQQTPHGQLPQFFDPNQLAFYQHMMMQQAFVQQQAAAALQYNMQNGFNPQMHPAASGMLPPNAYGFHGGTPPIAGHPPYGASPQQPAMNPAGQPGAHHRGNRPNDWNRGQLQPPYARPDAASSSNSVNSSTGGNSPATPSSSAPRHRSNSGSAQSTHSHSGSLRGAPQRGATIPALPSSASSSNSRNGGSPNMRGVSTNQQYPHQRNTSASSNDPRSGIPKQNSAGPGVPSSASHGSSSPNSSPILTNSPSSPLSNSSRPAQRLKPSPLSQNQTFEEPSTTSAAASSAAVKANRRLSKDDSELLPQTASIHVSRSIGLKGRFKRAMTLNSLDEDGSKTPDASAQKDLPPAPDASVSGSPSDTIPPVIPPEGKKKSRSLFNGRFNASTDNISLSSTVSSASVMIRKLGSIGKLARKNSLINLFKDREKKNKDKEGKDKSNKGAAAPATVSGATAEIDRFGGMSSAEDNDPSLRGLSPAAKLARQHTLRSNAAEAARRLREQQEQQRPQEQQQRAQQAGSSGVGGVPSPWENDTASRARNAQGGAGEMGRFGDSDDDFDDEDVTIRLPPSASFTGGPLPTGRPSLVEEAVEDEEDDEEVRWAIGIDREAEKAKKPGKSIIKNAKNFIQEQHLDGGKEFMRVRHDSYSTGDAEQPGPLAHLPPADPDHIDGIQKPVAHASTSSSSTTTATPTLDTSFTLPPLDFDFEKKDREDENTPLVSNKSRLSIDADHSHPPTLPSHTNTPYTHPSLTSSAPTLSLLTTPTSHSAPHTFGMRVKKKISFAETLAIFDTFGASMYDRRSEPSTANRLTPALAQRIKEELNSFKMEEMEVHAASRIHTHFFV